MRQAAGAKPYARERRGALDSVEENTTRAEEGRMRFQGPIILCAALLALPAGRALAQQEPDRGYQDRYDRDDIRRHFTDHDRRVLNDWYRDHADRFEPRDAVEGATGSR